MPDLTASQTLVFVLVLFVIYVVITLVTGEAAIEGQDEGINRRKEPVKYWLFVSVFIMLIVGIVVTLVSSNSN